MKNSSVNNIFCCQLTQLYCLILEFEFFKNVSDVKKKKKKCISLRCWCNLINFIYTFVIVTFSFTTQGRQCFSQAWYSLLHMAEWPALFHIMSDTLYYNTGMRLVLVLVLAFVSGPKKARSPLWRGKWIHTYVAHHSAHELSPVAFSVGILYRVRKSLTWKAPINREEQ